jgi:hypothetical protein
MPKGFNRCLCKLPQIVLQEIWMASHDLNARCGWVFVCLGSFPLYKQGGLSAAKYVYVLFDRRGGERGGFFLPGSVLMAYKQPPVSTSLFGVPQFYMIPNPEQLEIGVSQH